MYNGEFHLSRDTVHVGRTFSEEALRNLTTEVAQFVVASIAHRWETSGVPATALTLKVELELH